MKAFAANVEGTYIVGGDLYIFGRGTLSMNITLVSITLSITDIIVIDYGWCNALIVSASEDWICEKSCYLLSILCKWKEFNIKIRGWYVLCLGSQITPASSYLAMEKMSFQDPAMMMDLDPRESSTPVSGNGTQNGGGISHAEFASFNSMKIESDLEAMGIKLKQHDDNLKVLNSQKNKLDESIIDLQVHMRKLPSSVTPRIEINDTNLQGEDISEYQNSTAGVLGRFQSCFSAQASRWLSTKGVLGIVAKLGKVIDDNLSRVLSQYLGTHSMMAIVCENYDNAKALEYFDSSGNIDRYAGIHGLASAIGGTIEGKFDAICLEHLRPYVGEYIADDPQRRLDLLKPKLPNGELPPGFLGFAVNFIEIDPEYLHGVTACGFGLRETLFYSLLASVQVYETRLDMINAALYMCDGAVSLDGGIIRRTGVLALGNGAEVKVRFAKPSGSRAMENYSNAEKQMKELKRKKEKVMEDIMLERVLSDQTMFSFNKKKEEFRRFVAQPHLLTRTK